jgi:hypothetical protein
MMDMYALPIELLDERELHNRYKEIDAAVERAKENIARSVQPQHARPPVKLAQPLPAQH